MRLFRSRWLQSPCGQVSSGPYSELQPRANSFDSVPHMHSKHESSVWQSGPEQIRTPSLHTSNFPLLDLRLFSEVGFNLDESHFRAVCFSVLHSELSFWHTHVCHALPISQYRPSYGSSHRHCAAPLTTRQMPLFMHGLPVHGVVGTVYGVAGGANGHWQRGPHQLGGQKQVPPSQVTLWAQ